MARLEPVGYFPKKQTSQKDDLVLYDSLIQHISNFVDEISEGLQVIRQTILSILMPKLYAIIG